MAITQKVVTERRLTQYHELLKKKIANDIEKAINNLASVAKTGNIEDFNQENTIIFYGGSAADLVNEEEEGEDV